MHLMIVGAPFGNYLWPPGYTPTIGSFTRYPNGGLAYRAWRVARTVRFYPAVGACVNKLGLPNPGVGSLLGYNAGGQIVSIAARNTEDWLWVLTFCGYQLRNAEAVELNVSCPNCDNADTSDYEQVFAYAASLPMMSIVKLPPFGYRVLARMAYERSIRTFHCCNTLWTPAGGMSGKPLQALSLEATRYCRKELGATVYGGGGVVGPDDVKRFEDAGAERFVVSSAWFNPFRWPTLRRIGRVFAEQQAEQERKRREEDDRRAQSNAKAAPH